jgi:hypothetical protein
MMYIMQNEGMTSGQHFLWLILFILYLLPALIAGRRRHRQKLAITVLNILAGWTAIGWLVALVWACTADVDQAPVIS